MSISFSEFVSDPFRLLRVLLLAAAAVLLVAACATGGTPHGDLDRYLGRSLDAVKDDFGPGYREEVTADGRRVVTWAWQEPGGSTGYRPPSTSVQLGRVVVMPEAGATPGSLGGPLCEYTFYAGADGVVDGWEAFGAACSGAGGVAAK